MRPASRRLLRGRAQFLHLLRLVRLHETLPAAVGGRVEEFDDRVADFAQVVRFAFDQFRALRGPLHSRLPAVVEQRRRIVAALHRLQGQLVGFDLAAVGNVLDRNTRRRGVGERIEQLVSPGADQIGQLRVVRAGRQLRRREGAVARIVGRVDLQVGAAHIDHLRAVGGVGWPSVAQEIQRVVARVLE